jgi:hypothetical protein
MAYAETIARVSCRARRGTSVQQFVQWLMPCPPLWVEGEPLDPIGLCFKLRQHICCCVVLLQPATPPKSSTQRGPIRPIACCLDQTLITMIQFRTPEIKQTAGLIIHISNTGLGTAGVSWPTRCGTTPLGLELDTVVAYWTPAPILLPCE